MEHEAYIIDTLKTLLALLRVAHSDISTERDERTSSVRFSISTPDAILLIGEKGDRLMAINHLIKRMVEKHAGDTEPSFMVDINDYQKKHIDDIRAKAHMLAERARYFKSSVEMDPMSSYERMIVHAEFSDTNDIITESTGGGRDRRVIIRYAESKGDELAKSSSPSP